MTVPAVPLGNSSRTGRRPNGTASGDPSSSKGGDSSKARIFLLAACVWPLVVLALFASSAPHVRRGADGEVLLPGTTSADGIVGGNTGAEEFFSVKNILDRVDILGYGPTHPRVAVVIVGDDRDDLVSTLESVFHYTDLNRIFVVVAVVDGKEEDLELERELRKIDAGAIPHWHGKQPDIHSPGQKELDDEDPHGKKVHVIFNPQKLGIAESRADAVQFVEILAKHHEEAGLKSPHEDLILLLMRSGAQLTSTKWLPPVTQALIVPPPLLGREDPTIAMKLANAVSFNLEGPGKRTSFDITFTPKVSEPTADEINESSGASYPTPALSGAATAMRLETYLNLPSQDPSLRDEWPANLELALNLWLCADGIDVLKDLEVTSFRQPPAAPLAPEQAARFAAAWMDQVTARKFFNAYTKTYDKVTYLEWEKLMSRARETPGFAKGLAKKCRSFRWYAERINPDVSDILSETSIVGADMGTDDKEEEHSNDDADDDDAKQKKKEAAAAAAAGEKPAEQDHHHPPDGNNAEDEDVSIPERKDKKKPAKPLCPECLEIVQKAESIDTTYEDVTGGHKEHPHLGATEADGVTFGYVHDETALRLNPPPFSFKGDALQHACEKRDNNYRMLHEKVVVDLEGHEDAQKSGKKRDTIFCLVYTIDSGHPRIPSIRETWGQKCDGFMVGSNKTDPSIGAVNIVHEGPEEYGNIWQKVRSMWSYIYDNYYDKYDWFHIGGDDLYLIVENLRLYLESEEIQTAANGGMYLPDGTETHQTPLFLGRRFSYQGDMDDIFNSGGSGYTLNKAALKTMVVKGFPKYYPHYKTFSEDTMVARLLKTYGVLPYETKDEAGGERYMPFMPGHHYGYRMPQDHSKDWYAKYSINIKEGVDHCAVRSVAFHYVKGDAMYRIHALLYHLCPMNTQ